MSCTTSGTPQGVGSCAGIQEKIINWLIEPIGADGFAPIAGQTLDDINDVDSWTARANPGLAMYRFPAFSADNEKEGGDAVTVDNSSDGSKYHIRYNSLSFKAFIESNDNDWGELKKTFVAGSRFKVYAETATTIRHIYSKMVGDVQVLNGRTAEVVANPNNSVVADDGTQGYEVMINFKDQDEAMSEVTIKKPSGFGLSMEDAIPNGLTLSVIDKSTIATASVRVINRANGDGYVGLLPADFIADGVALVAASDDGDGLYTVDLTDVKELQIKVGSTTFTYVSNILAV